MYLHLGQDTVITTETVIGIFNMDECTVSKKTRDYLTARCCSRKGRSSLNLSNTQLSVRR